MAHWLAWSQHASCAASLQAAAALARHQARTVGGRCGRPLPLKLCNALLGAGQLLAQPVALRAELGRLLLLHLARGGLLLRRRQLLLQPLHLLLQLRHLHTPGMAVCHLAWLAACQACWLGLPAFPLLHSSL